MDTLPKDVLFDILLRSDYATVRRLCSTDKRINAICQDQYFWFEKNKRDFDQNTKDSNKSWLEEYKHHYDEKYPLKGYEVMTGIIVLLMVRDQEEIYQVLTNIYNDNNKILNYRDQYIQDELIELVNEKITQENEIKLVKYRKIVNSYIRKYQINYLFKTLTNDQIHTLVREYYLTPNLLYRIHDRYQASEILQLFKYLYDNNIAKPLFEEVPDCNSLIEYYNNSETSKPVKYIKSISVEAMKNIVLNKKWNSYRNNIEEISTWELKHNRYSNHYSPSQKYYQDFL